MALRYDEQALNGDAGDDRAEEPDRDEDDREAEMTLCFGDQIFLYDMENKGFVFNAASGCVPFGHFEERAVAVLVWHGEYTEQLKAPKEPAGRGGGAVTQAQRCSTLRRAEQ